MLAKMNANDDRMTTDMGTRGTNEYVSSSHVENNNKGRDNNNSQPGDIEEMETERSTSEREAVETMENRGEKEKGNINRYAQQRMRHFMRQFFAGGEEASSRIEG